MHSELIVVTFAGEGEARRVYDALRAMRRSPLFGLENTLIVTRDRAGKLKLRHDWELPEAGRGRDHDLLSNLAGLIFTSSPDRAVGTLGKAGLEQRLLEQVARSVGSDASALFFLVPPGGVSDADVLLGALRLFKGRVHRTTLPPAAEAALLELGG
jgi:uncharacterized membrane protein